MTNVEALKACYVAIGGSAADVADAKTTAAVIEAISTIASGGGGGESPFFIVPNPDGDTGELDLTPSELITAMETGKLPITPTVSGNEYYLSIVSVAAPMDFGDGELYYLYYFGDDMTQPANIHATGPNAHYFADNY